MPAAPQAPAPNDLAGLRVAFLGKLAGMPRRQAQELVRARGGLVVEQPLADGLRGADLIVVGEDDLPLGNVDALLDTAARQAVDQGTLSVITETELWRRLGIVEGEQNVHRLYTAGMLADLLGVSKAIIRRWQRRGLIVAAREVRKLAYFDFREVATARRLAELLAAGVSPQAIEKKLAALERLLPGVERPLAQLSVIVEGKELLLRQGDGLIEPGGQLRFDFDSPAVADQAAEAPPTLRYPLEPKEPPLTAAQMRDMAAGLEDAGELDAAAEMYRASLAAGGPDAETCFLLAELLYRQGDPSAARERYYMAIELDEDYVEARANLGCVLAETGHAELAVAAFQGALAYHADYPDAHYHLARALDDLGRSGEATHHWRAFLSLSPDSPWSHAARERLGEMS